MLPICNHCNAPFKADLTFPGKKNQSSVGINLLCSSHLLLLIIIIASAFSGSRHLFSTANSWLTWQPINPSTAETPLLPSTNHNHACPADFRNLTLSVQMVLQFYFIFNHSKQHGEPAFLAYGQHPESMGSLLTSDSSCLAAVRVTLVFTTSN